MVLTNVLYNYRWNL